MDSSDLMRSTDLALAFSPALMARAAFGEMAEALLLCSCRVKPFKLQQGKFEFAYPELEGVLSDYLGKNKTVSKVVTGVSE